MDEHVVLVDENNAPVGITTKASIHSLATPLHRGFSVFVFNRTGKLLLQQRAHTKVTWPLVWSNSCCGHPMLNESLEDAAQRRLFDELGLTVEDIKVVLPNYRYRAEKDGVVENEFCPVMVAFTDQTPRPNPVEVQLIRWIPWQSFVEEVRENPARYSPWCAEETLLLDQEPSFQQLFTAKTSHTVY